VSLVELNEIERRVFGVLIEKSLAQPTYYPMTLNAVIAACNQKSNRDPVMALDEDTVWNALDALRERGFVSRILAGMSGRVDRFRHEVKTAFNWEKPQRAIMAELMLRGPQTLGELRTRCTRLYPFENADAVAAVVQMLCESDPPLVAPLPRAPGQSAVRYAHRLYPAGERPEAAEPQPEAAEPQPVAPAVMDSAAASGGVSGPANSRLQEIEEELAGLREALTDLQRRLSALEQQLQ
jgi:uncharacterized protein YceH (UPF0502 family)